MKNAMTGVGLVLAMSLILPAAANAQRAGNKSRDQERPDRSQPAGASESAGGGQVKLGERTLTISKSAFKPIQELQAAVNANDPTMPAKLAAAKAAAQSADDRYLVAQLQLQAAAKAKDEAGMAAAMEAQIASGAATPQEVAKLTTDVAKLHFSAKRYDQAASALERAMQASPNDGQLAVLLAETRHAQGRTADAIAQLQKSIATSKAAGQKPDERVIKRAIALAYEMESPAAVALAQDWVQAYPTDQNWKEALRVYRNIHDLDDATTLDTLRLAQLTGGMEGVGDYHRFGYIALSAANPNEALTVVQEGVSANKIDGNDKLFKDILTEAKQKSQGQQARLPALTRDSLSGSNAGLAIRTADILYGYGEYDKAAELYRAALGKSGADKNLVNLRLGMALARAGDKAGATAAFQSVAGQRADLAKFWMIYLNSRA